jgi:hypothetical protein
MRDHVLPILGPLDVFTFDRDDVERVRDELDEKIVEGRLAWKTAASVWTLVTSICSDIHALLRRGPRLRPRGRRGRLPGPSTPGFIEPALDVMGWHTLARSPLGFRHDSPLRVVVARLHPHARCWDAR